jgi:hypothetical protein
MNLFAPSNDGENALIFPAADDLLTRTLRFSHAVPNLPGHGTLTIERDQIKR